jgi:hypothetical protein
MTFTEDIETEKEVGKWEKVGVIGEVRKNKYTVIEVSRVKLHTVKNKGKEFIQIGQFEVKNDGTKTPVKNMSMTITPETAAGLGDILNRIETPPRLPKVPSAHVIRK